MLLNLTEEEKNYVKITYETDHFNVNFGKNGSVKREYYLVKEMMKEFQENEIGSADFDDEAHEMFKKGMAEDPYIPT